MSLEKNIRTINRVNRFFPLIRPPVFRDASNRIGIFAGVERCEGVRELHNIHLDTGVVIRKVDQLTDLSLPKDLWSLFLGDAIIDVNITEDGERTMINGDAVERRFLSSERTHYRDLSRSLEAGQTSNSSAPNLKKLHELSGDLNNISERRNALGLNKDLNINRPNNFDDYYE